MRPAWTTDYCNYPDRDCPWKFIFHLLFLFYVYECIACIDVSAPLLYNRGQKRVLDPLELELQMVVSHHMVVGNQTQVLLKAQPVLLTAEPSLQLCPWKFLRSKKNFIWQNIPLEDNEIKQLLLAPSRCTNLLLSYFM